MTSILVCPTYHFVAEGVVGRCLFRSLQRFKDSIPKVDVQRKK